MDFVSLLGGIVLGAAGAALFDQSTGSGMLGNLHAAPQPPERQRSAPMRVPAPVPQERVQVRFPVVNRLGGWR